jgi:hypothetical protein
MTTVVTPEMFGTFAGNVFTTVVVGYQIVATTVTAIQYVKDKTRKEITKFRSRGINKPVVGSKVLSHTSKPVSEGESTPSAHTSNPVSEDKEPTPLAPKRGRVPRVSNQKKSR